MTSRFLTSCLLSLSLGAGAVQADDYNDYLIDQSSRIANGSAAVQDLFGNPQLVSLAEAGNVRAQYELGMLKYSLGDNAGIQWLEKAAAQGNVRAQFILGGIYIEGKAAPRDMKKAFNLVDTCSKLGNPECSFYVGMFYEEGHGVVLKNAALAKWYQEDAANSGFQRAIDHLCGTRKDCQYRRKD